MTTNLPTELLRSFVAIVDAGSMQRATERIFVTQSAISLQMKRLEDLIQRPLFDRRGRQLILTPAGDALLSHAREMLAINDRVLSVLQEKTFAGPVRIGLVQDFAETLLAGVLRQFSQLHPEAQLQVRIAGSQELNDLLASDQLDIVLALAPEQHPSAVKTAPALWIGNPELAEQDVLPLAILDKPCLFRSAALKVLEENNIRYRIAAETPNLSALRAAVQAGLGLTSRTRAFMNGGWEAGLIKSLPALPKVAYTLIGGPAPTPAVSQIHELIRVAVLDLD